jgi:putative transcriptional regulator
MRKQDKTKKRLLSEAHEMAQSLRQAGAINMATMREFDALCIAQIHELSASKIKKIRRYAGVSQAVFAKIINVSVAAIRQWERGERKPSGAALKLLNLVEAKGLEAVL